jgi:hypothetical protein
VQASTPQSASSRGNSSSSTFTNTSSVSRSCQAGAGQRHGVCAKLARHVQGRPAHATTASFVLRMHLCRWPRRHAMRNWAVCAVQHNRGVHVPSGRCAGGGGAQGRKRHATVYTTSVHRHAVILSLPGGTSQALSTHCVTSGLCWCSLPSAPLTPSPAPGPHHELQTQVNWDFWGSEKTSACKTPCNRPLNCLTASCIISPPAPGPASAQHQSPSALFCAASQALTDLCLHPTQNSAPAGSGFAVARTPDKASSWPLTDTCVQWGCMTLSHRLLPTTILEAHAAVRQAAPAACASTIPKAHAGARQAPSTVQSSQVLH